MILVDTSVWTEHFHAADATLSGLLEAQRVLGHPWVYGELLLGGLPTVSPAAHLLPLLPAAVVASPAEVRVTIGEDGLARTGVGYVGAALLAATRLTPDARLWTRDRKLHAVAERLGLAYLAD